MLARIPLKSQSYESRIHCWAIRACQRNAIEMAFRWRAVEGPPIVIFWILLQLIKLKKSKKKSQSLTPSDQTFWIRA